MANVRNIVVSIGGAESTAGEEVSRTATVPIRSMPSVTKTAQKELDPAIVGQNMDAGEFSVAYDVAGQIAVTPRPSAALGMLLTSVLGEEEASPQQVAACIRIRYTGSEDSAKISADGTADELTSEVGDKGSESGDDDFGTSGTIDLTSTSTVGALVTEIDGYTDYEAEKVFGEDSVDTGEIIDITESQGKDRWVYIWFASSDSGVYRHQWQVDLTNTERPTYTLQIDELHDNFVYPGIFATQLSLSAALMGLVEMDFEVLGMTESDGETAYSGSDLEDHGPLLFQRGSFAIGGTDFAFVRDISLTMGNNPNTDGYGMGSLYRQYHQKGKFEASGDLQIRHDSDVYSLRATVFDDSMVALTLSFQPNADLVTGYPGLFLVELPAVQLSDYQPTENGDQIDASISFRAVNPGGLYDSAVQVTMLTEDSGEYN
ncbi:MAG: phage tail tube protein [Spirochaetaceae bacterium]